jgi:Zn-finger nucleic acid-binding protein
MNCPRDASPLTSRRFDEIDVQMCAACGGMFVEGGELNPLSGPTLGDLEYSTLDADSGRHADEFGPAPCPRDAAPMEKVEFNIETEIILDHCATCGAFWLDGRELTRIHDEVRNLNEAARQVPDPPLVRFSRFIWSLPVPH